MYNLEKTMVSANIKQMNDSDVLNFERKKSLTFNLGLIGYQLITGIEAVKAET